MALPVLTLTQANSSGVEKLSELALASTFLSAAPTVLQPSPVKMTSALVRVPEPRSRWHTTIFVFPAVTGPGKPGSAAVRGILAQSVIVPLRIADTSAEEISVILRFVLATKPKGCWKRSGGGLGGSVP